MTMSTTTTTTTRTAATTTITATVSPSVSSHPPSSLMMSQRSGASFGNLNVAVVAATKSDSDCSYARLYLRSPSANKSSTRCYEAARGLAIPAYAPELASCVPYEMTKYSPLNQYAFSQGKCAEPATSGRYMSVGGGDTLDYHQQQHLQQQQQQQQQQQSQQSFKFAELQQHQQQTIHRAAGAYETASYGLSAADLYASSSSIGGGIGNLKSYGCSHHHQPTQQQLGQQQQQSVGSQIYRGLHHHHHHHQQDMIGCGESSNPEYSHESEGSTTSASAAHSFCPYATSPSPSSSSPSYYVPPR